MKYKEVRILDDKYLILSDIHGNLSAFEAVLSDCNNELYTGVILLGDLIDYGMRSNEVINRITLLEKTDWKNKVLVNIWGNHEKIFVDKVLDRLSSERGRDVAKYTAKTLSHESGKYIKLNMNNKGFEKICLNGFSCMAVHGSLEDYFWKAITPDKLNGEYSDYDIVLGGHSHCSHCFTYFYNVDSPKYRNKKAVLFINPGSVGQPRNQNPRAQYAILSLPSKSVEMRTVEYDIGYEQSLYPEEIDDFYKTRLSIGV